MKVWSTASASGVAPKARIPGVSIIFTSPCNSWREVVVWRPLPSAARTLPVARLVPKSALVSVDLPAPERPTSTKVSPGVKLSFSSATAWVSVVFSAVTDSTKGSHCSIAPWISWPTTRSALVSTTRALMALAWAIATNRSTRPIEKAGCNGSTITSSSTLAAMAWLSPNPLAAGRSM